VVVARFLALLELFREGAVAFDQMSAFGELTIRWTGADEGEVDVEGDFDVESGPSGRQGGRPSAKQGGQRTGGPGVCE